MADKVIIQEKTVLPTACEQSSSANALRSPGRFHLRACAREGELCVANFAELQRLYHSGFIAPEDEIRRDGSDTWQKAGSMPELNTAKPRPWLEGNEFALLAALICALSLVLIFLFRFLND